MNATGQEPPPSPDRLRQKAQQDVLDKRTTQRAKDADDRATHLVRMRRELDERRDR